MTSDLLEDMGIAQDIVKAVDEKAFIKVVA